MRGGSVGGRKSGGKNTSTHHVRILLHVDLNAKKKKAQKKKVTTRKTQVFNNMDRRLKNGVF